MRFKKMLIALVACTALVAVSASSAQAQWLIEGRSPEALGAGESETVKLHKKAGTELVLHSELLSIPITLTAENIECSGTCKIEGAANGSSGTLKFTGVTVDLNKTKEANPVCKVPGGTVTTAALKDTAAMDTTAGSTVVFDRFFPATEGGAFATITLEGAECPLAGNSAEVKGTACGQSPNATGAKVLSQLLIFSEAAQTTGGCALTLGKKAAQLTGEVENELSGTNVGKKFGANSTNEPS
jgi:hypothetical protein